MPRYEFGGTRPQVGAGTFIHPQATVIGDVVIGERCYIGPGAVLRGDYGRITIGDGSNIQDNSVAHGAVNIGRNTLVGHNCVIHMATLGDGVFVGIGAIVMDDCDIGDGCIIGAGSLVVTDTKVPQGKLVVGSPASIVRDVSPEAAQRTAMGITVYQELPQKCVDTLREITDEMQEVE